MKAAIIMACVLALPVVAETTVYFDDGTSLSTESNVYISDSSLYAVTGTYQQGFEVSPVAPVTGGGAEEPTDPEVCYEGTWAVPCDEVTPPDPFEGLCDGPRPTGYLTFELMYQQKYWDKNCKDGE